MRKILSMLALTVAVSYSAAAQNAPIHWYVDSTSTNVIDYIFGTSEDSAQNASEAYEGSFYIKINFETAPTGWWAGNGAFDLQNWGFGESQDLTNHTHLELAIRSTGQVGSDLAFKFMDADSTYGPLVTVFQADGSADYQIIKVSIDDIKGSLDISQIIRFDWEVHANVETGSGTFFIDYIRLIDETTTSVKNKTLTELTVGPNPSNGIYKIESQERLDQVIVSDALGAVVKTVSVSGTSAEIDLTGKPEGIYYLRAIAGEKSSTTKVIKN